MLTTWWDRILFRLVRPLLVRWRLVAVDAGRYANWTARWAEAARWLAVSGNVNDGTTGAGRMRRRELRYLRRLLGRAQ
jgi:hypothetical protein